MAGWQDDDTQGASWRPLWLWLCLDGDASRLRPCQTGCHALPRVEEPAPRHRRGPAHFRVALTGEVDCQPKRGEGSHCPYGISDVPPHEGASESIAGRIRIIQMPSLVLRALMECPDNPHPHVPHEINEPQEPDGLPGLWRTIHRGSMQELRDGSIDWDSFCPTTRALS